MYVNSLGIVQQGTKESNGLQTGWARRLACLRHHIRELVNMLSLAAGLLYWVFLIVFYLGVDCSIIPVILQTQSEDQHSDYMVQLNNQLVSTGPHLVMPFVSRNSGPSLPVITVFIIVISEISNNSL